MPQKWESKRQFQKRNVTVSSLTSVHVHFQSCWTVLPLYSKQHRPSSRKKIFSTQRLLQINKLTPSLPLVVMEETKESTPAADDQPKHEEESGPLLKKNQAWSRWETERKSLAWERISQDEQRSQSQSQTGRIPEHRLERKEWGKQTTQCPPTPPTLPLPSNPKYSSASDAEEFERLSSSSTFLDSASGDWQLPVLQRKRTWKTEHPLALLTCSWTSLKSMCVLTMSFFGYKIILLECWTCCTCH